jgi:hypothetical protein
MSQDTATRVEYGERCDLYYDARNGATCIYAMVFSDEVRGLSAMFELGALTEGSISGVTRDDAGTALGNCIVRCFQTSNDVKVAQTKSDPSGNYTIWTFDKTTQHYLVDYLPGAPDNAGTTVNTVVGT